MLARAVVCNLTYATPSHWLVSAYRKLGSFGLEVSGGQRKFPGGQNSSQTSLG